MMCPYLFKCFADSLPSSTPEIFFAKTIAFNVSLPSNSVSSPEPTTNPASGTTVTMAGLPALTYSSKPAPIGTKHTSKVAAGVIAGITIGVVSTVCLLLLLLWLRRRRSQKVVVRVVQPVIMVEAAMASSKMIPNDHSSRKPGTKRTDGRSRQHLAVATAMGSNEGEGLGSRLGHVQTWACATTACT